MLASKGFSVIGLISGYHHFLDRFIVEHRILFLSLIALSAEYRRFHTLGENPLWVDEARFGFFLIQNGGVLFTTSNRKKIELVNSSVQTIEMRSAKAGGATVFFVA